MTPFTPIRDDGRSFSQVAYEYLERLQDDGSLKPGDIIKHADLAGEMEIDYPSSSYFGAMTKAAVMLQRRRSRSLVPIRGTGYQLIDGMGMVDKGRGHHKRARRQSSKALAVVDAVDEDDVLPAQVPVVRQIQKGFAIVGAVLAQQAEQIADLYADQTALKRARMDDRAATASDLAEIRDRLLQLEKKRGEPDK